MEDEPDGRPAVLLVEDNEVNQAVAAAILRRRGYRVDVAENGREAVEAVERRAYAAVIMDCQMPVMDGYEATVELRRREQDGAHLPIIALTAHAAERERCLACGMDDFLTKPVRPEDLVDALARVVGEEAVVDRSALTELGEALGADTVARIVDVFIGEAADQLATITQADDAAAIKRAAHLLRSGAETVGAVAVAGLAGEIERTGDRALAGRLVEAFARTRGELG